MDYKVESVSEFKGDTLRVDFDCREPIFVNKTVVYELHIAAGKTLSEEDIFEAVHRNDFRRARERALYLLDERDYGYVEMFRKLEKNYSEDICYEVVDNLAKIGLIDDRRYAERLAEYLLTRKMWGEYRAREEMRKRGLSREITDAALSEYASDATDRLLELIRRKYLRKLGEENGANKVKAALARQGYGYDEINAAIAEIESESEDEE